MKKTAADIFIVLFWALTFFNLTGIMVGAQLVYLVTKPLLAPSLILSLAFSNLPIRRVRPIIAGLVFSFFGDTLLLFENRNALFFVFGLASFLITHICYIAYFLQIKSPLPSLVRKQPWTAALVAAYGVSLVLFLQPFLGALKVPVIIYAATICCMMICSLHVFLRTGKPANILFVAGALLFVSSDSLLAVNKFHSPIPFANVLIMATYCAAQFCIVQGVLRRKY